MSAENAARNGTLKTGLAFPISRELIEDWFPSGRPIMDNWPKLMLGHRPEIRYRTFVEQGSLFNSHDYYVKPQPRKPAIMGQQTLFDPQEYFDECSRAHSQEPPEGLFRPSDY